MLDPRYLTGPALIVVGTLLLYIANRLWMVHPINRVFRLGPFVTAEGMESLLRMRVTFLAFGLLLTESGVYRCAYWYFDQRVDAPWIMFLGALETGLSLWAACLALIGGFRIWRAR